ncbi:Cyclic di-GMP phosphodiesterase [Phycisphaerales bacterium]|nr:Cyclic di-GMP phosphodiesterase [Phycisphaerales bacterium]
MSQPHSGLCEGTVRTCEQDLLLSGTGGGAIAGRSGLLPIALDGATPGALRGIGVYLRVRDTWDRRPTADETGFTLYCETNTDFTSEHRARLAEHGVKFVYIRNDDALRFQEQTVEVMRKSGVRDLAEREAALVYETSVQLVSDLLLDPSRMVQSQRVRDLSGVIAKMVLKDRKFFGHLFVAAHHDFYTATHMVNVGTWMVSLAAELGYTDYDELSDICQAGLLHDIGKLRVPAQVLNKKERLAPEEWEMIRGHSRAGYEYLSRYPEVPEVAKRVALEHHERQDGTGYPSGLRDNAIHPISRVCAVVDSFDAMTAVRPFKSHTFTMDQALAELEKEGAKFDLTVLATWIRMVRAAPAGEVMHVGRALPEESGRKHERASLRCGAEVQLVLFESAKGSRRYIAHNISRSGVGLLGPWAIEPGETVRVYLDAPGWGNRMLVGRVVRCRRYQDGMYEVGVRFTDVDGA